ncbi:4-amino-4-deoxy-L-arabinose transferase [Hymenobacter daecheongensis DSM 21074]|uniref:4-amino-4-deoxy-L-arabinose transferase n=1 Tax=Hymenobacter daecheongensis DSM 21074 TaxID=1121955 RepID=A0A1M6D3D7_9BACT|nr:hypothetical protein [Hymenobacter daecheongensis]SHI67584.1 4-amino-4-deoxy-L-arabinose transferase [Hymenobacter daecheongensis DSM 21074]
MPASPVLSAPEPAAAGRRPALLLLAALFGLSVLFAVGTTTTYDTGDSINHYLYSRYAFRHPANFLESWAKPLFVLLTAGPAQLGFVGIKLFNCAVVAAAAWLAYRVAARLRLPWPWLAVLFTYAAPDYFRIQFSGLTEPLFSLILVAGVWLAFSNRTGWSAAVMSFLPFVRSEGFLLLGVWAVYLALSRQWRPLPLLVLGYLVYSVAGLLVYGDFLWVFTHNAYPYRATQYGHGDITHYLTHLPGVIGLVLFVLFWMGGIRVLSQWLRPRFRPQPDLFRAELLLIYGSVVVYCGAHTLFWWQGIFASFGMVRVLNAMVPLMAIIALNGVQALALLAKSARGQQRVRLGLTAAVVLFLFTGARTAFRWQRDFTKAADVRLADKAGAWFAAAYPGPKPMVVTEHPYLAEALQIDPFDKTQRRNISFLRARQPEGPVPPAGSLIFWDDWFSVIEGGVPLSRLRHNPQYRLRWQGAKASNLTHPDADSCHLAVFERL